MFNFLQILIDLLSRYFPTAMVALSSAADFLTLRKLGWSKIGRPGLFFLVVVVGVLGIPSVKNASQRTPSVLEATPDGSDLHATPVGVPLRNHARAKPVYVDLGNAQSESQVFLYEGWSDSRIYENSEVRDTSYRSILPGRYAFTEIIGLESVPYYLEIVILHNRCDTSFQVVVPTKEEVYSFEAPALSTRKTHWVTTAEAIIGSDMVVDGKLTLRFNKTSKQSCAGPGVISFTLTPIEE